MSDDLGAMLTVVRHVGNMSIHPEGVPDDLLVMVFDPDDEEITAFLFESINDVVDERIVRPARRNAPFAKVPEQIRTKVVKKTPPPKVT